MRNTSIAWSAVERDYREGRLSLRQLARKHRCSHSTIANYAGRHGWTRDGGPCEIGAAPESEQLLENVDLTIAPMEYGYRVQRPGTPCARPASTTDDCFADRN